LAFDISRRPAAGSRYLFGAGPLFLIEYLWIGHGTLLLAASGQINQDNTIRYF
jgi:hypothetical protein